VKREESKASGAERVLTGGSQARGEEKGRDREKRETSDR